MLMIAIFKRSAKFLMLLFVLAFVLVVDAHSCVLKGAVIDKSTKQYIPYVSIYLEGSNGIKKQGLSNEYGYFEIAISELEYPVTLELKSISYLSHKINISNCNKLEIELYQSIVDVKQVEVSDLSKKSIVENCLKNMGANLYEPTFNYYVFYRKTQTDANEKFNYSTEYYSKIYQQRAKQPGIENLKTRFIGNDDTYYDKALREGNWEIRFMLSYELYSLATNKYSIGIVSSKNINDLSFYYLGEIVIDNEEYHKIGYEGDTRNEDYRKGEMYINKSNFSLIYFSSDLYVNKKIKIKKEFYYDKVNNHYLLSYIKERTLNNDNTIDDKILYVNKYEFDKVQVLDNNIKSIINSSFKKEQHFESDSVFWNGVNYIPRR